MTKPEALEKRIEALLFCLNQMIEPFIWLVSFLEIFGAAGCATFALDNKVCEAAQRPKIVWPFARRHARDTENQNPRRIQDLVLPPRSDGYIPHPNVDLPRERWYEDHKIVAPEKASAHENSLRQRLGRMQEHLSCYMMHHLAV